MKTTRIHVLLTVSILITLSNVTGAQSQAPASVWKQLAKLTSKTGRQYDELGFHAVISNDTVVANSGDGHVYVFVRPASGWKNTHEVAQLGANNQYPGSSVTISGDTIVVGVVGATNQQDAVDVFVKPKGGWVDTNRPNATLTSSDQGAGIFGVSTAIDGNTIVVGAPCKLEDSCSGPGAAYIFVKPASGWKNSTETAILSPSDGMNDDQFGDSVSIHEDTVAVGSAKSSGGRGAIYVYVEPKSGWKSTTETARLGNPDHTFTGFGNTVANTRTTVVAGAAGAKGQSGEVWVFQKPGGKWKSTSKATARLTASDGSAYDAFGASVAVGNKTIFAGAPGKANQTGATYVYAEPAGGWKSTSKFTAELQAKDHSSGTDFGYSVTFDGITMVSSAPDETIKGVVDQGAVYVFGPSTGLERLQ
jgi:hypothetical protein